MAKTEDVFAKLADLNKLKAEGIRFLLKERRALDRKLAKLGHAFSAGVKRRTTGTRKCKVCGKAGHNARSHRKGP